MCRNVVASFLLVATVANAGVLHLQPAGILEGPSTKTKVVGPDGSIIDAYAPGGRIVLDGHAGPLAQPEPLVYASPAIAEPQIYGMNVHSAVAEEEPLTNSVENAKVIQTPLKEPSIEYNDGEEPKVLLHPGTEPRVETRESIPITEEPAETTRELTTDATYTTVGFGVSDVDLSGRYIPDNLEQLYDDGSYRVEHY
ncbi:uncharacterized protein LOC132701185 [Cylas formicarius]|uniref:uncharacterized protein LOC132701185 n=1 Tax=Cylas formicarius TaxID=197179 RepID=UPI00295843C1|nr:uncharacterized protein LOC132701185 [Cylas formicarius]